MVGFFGGYVGDSISQSNMWATNPNIAFNPIKRHICFDIYKLPLWVHRTNKDSSKFKTQTQAKFKVQAQANFKLQLQAKYKVQAQVKFKLCSRSKPKPN